MIKLYHKDVYMPAKLVHLARVGVVKLVYTDHARREALLDERNIIKLPINLNTVTAEVIEVEVEGDHITKVVYRTHYDERFDLILVVDRKGRVRTVWLNSKSDQHDTLKRSRYERRPING